MERILVIEDDPLVQNLLRHTLELADYRVALAGDGRSGLESFRLLSPDAVILDLRLPVISGRDVVLAIKRESKSTPVIILSGSADVVDRVVLLELGAADYLTKPFSPRELVARLQVALRRSPRSAVKRLTFGDVTVEVPAIEVTRKGKVVPLRKQERKLLGFLLSNPNRVMRKADLLQLVWGYQFYTSTKTVDNHFLRLRHKLEEDPGKPVHFITLHSTGYKFVP